MPITMTKEELIRMIKKLSSKEIECEFEENGNVNITILDVKSQNEGKATYITKYLSNETNDFIKFLFLKSNMISKDYYNIFYIGFRGYMIKVSFLSDILWCNGMREEKEE